MKNILIFFKPLFDILYIPRCSVPRTLFCDSKILSLIDYFTLRFYLGFYHKTVG